MCGMPGWVLARCLNVHWWSISSTNLSGVMWEEILDRFSSGFCFLISVMTLKFTWKQPQREVVFSWSTEMIVICFLCYLIITLCKENIRLNSTCVRVKPYPQDLDMNSPSGGGDQQVWGTPTHGLLEHFTQTSAEKLLKARANCCR